MLQLTRVDRLAADSRVLTKGEALVRVTRKSLLPPAPDASRVLNRVIRITEPLELAVDCGPVRLRAQLLNERANFDELQRKVTDGLRVRLFEHLPKGACRAKEEVVGRNE